MTEHRLPNRMTSSRSESLDSTSFSNSTSSSGIGSGSSIETATRLGWVLGDTDWVLGNTATRLGWVLGNTEWVLGDTEGLGWVLGNTGWVLGNTEGILDCDKGIGSTVIAITGSSPGYVDG